MKKTLIIMVSIGFLHGCDSTEERGKGGYANYSAGVKERQMAKALNSLRTDQVEHYRHFHVSAEEEEAKRMVLNLYETLSNPDYKIISVGCESIESCKQVVISALTLVSERGANRDDITIILPSSLSLPLQMRQSTEAMMVKYDTEDIFGK